MSNHIPVVKVQFDVDSAAEAVGSGWLEFISSMVSSLAWPVAVVIIAFAFRTKLSDLLSKVQKISWGDASIDLAEKLDDAEAASKEIAEEIVVREPAVPDDRFSKLVEISPSAAILDSWQRIERLLNERFVDEFLSGKRPISAHAVFRKLHREGKINSSTFNLLRELQQVRNIAVHEGEQGVTPTDAFRFYNMSKLLETALSLNIKNVEYS
jgi:hypothetical protein